MGVIATLRQEERIGLGAAFVLHALLVVALVIQVNFAKPLVVQPERMTVSLVSEVGLDAGAPDPVDESRAALAPELSDEIAPPAESRPEPVRPNTTLAPPRDPVQPARQPPKQTAERGGGSRIGEDFLPGRGDSTATDRTEAPAPQFGRRERAALASAITRQLRPHWNAPSGVDAEMLVSIVSWKLNVDGTLAGRPTCTTVPSSITASNRPQASLHCERAIRAVQLAAPFNLPEQFYSRWDELEWQFDRRL